MFFNPTFKRIALKLTLGIYLQNHQLIKILTLLAVVSIMAAFDKVKKARKKDTDIGLQY